MLLNMQKIVRKNCKDGEQNPSVNRPLSMETLKLPPHSIPYQHLKNNLVQLICIVSRI